MHKGELFLHYSFNSTNHSPVKTDEHANDARDSTKIEEIRENDVTYLPPPKPMSLDEDGNVVDTRIPRDLIQCSTKSVDFPEIFQRVIYSKILRIIVTIHYNFRMRILHHQNSHFFKRLVYNTA